MKKNNQNLRSILKKIYHKLPLSLERKWQLRARLDPLIQAFLNEPTILTISEASLEVFRQQAVQSYDKTVENALLNIVIDIEKHAKKYGIPSHWFALPFLTTGGAQMVALNLCNALRKLDNNISSVIYVTDKKFIEKNLNIDKSILIICFDDYISGVVNYEQKQALLRDLIVALKPRVFHNINSEVAWHLILSEGRKISSCTNIYASIFAFQYEKDGVTPIGYAEYYLKKSLPYLKYIISDNNRFVNDAARYYNLDEKDREKLLVLYQPCRLYLNDQNDSIEKRLSEKERANNFFDNSNSIERRLKVLWAGRLDAEKRVDLLIDIVRHCNFADFYIYGSAVVDESNILPNLPNLFYCGSFSSPLEWISERDYEAFIFTSKWEGMPNILIEVAELNIPIIAPTVGGVGELVTEATGYPIREKATVHDYEDALREILKSPWNALARVSSMKKFAHKQHGWQNFLNCIRAIPGYISEPNYSEIVGEQVENNLPLVSIIVPCYNQGRYLMSSIISALESYSGPLEIIIIDDGSTDPLISNHLLEVKNLAPEKIIISRQFNKGLSGARNAALDLAQGKYIQFLDSDDLLLPRKIDSQVAQLEINSGLSVSVCNYLLCDDGRNNFNKTEEAIARFSLSEEDFLFKWERGFVIPIHCGLFRGSLLKNIRFHVDVPAKEDWIFWTDIVGVGANFGYLNGHWAVYRQHAESMTRSYLKMGKAWLQAGLMIDSKVKENNPLFFEAVVSWFEQCYRSNPGYIGEVSNLLNVKSTDLIDSEKSTLEENYDIKFYAEKILKSISGLDVFKSSPLFSVIIPVYGHFNYLEKCLESVGIQKNIGIEIICINDASPDLRIKKLFDMMADRNPQLIVLNEEKNLGISEVQNKAVELAKGEFVVFLDCDDYLQSGALKAVAEVLRRNPDVDYIFTDRQEVDEFGSLLRIAKYGGYENIKFKSNEQIPSDLIDGMVASHLKVIRTTVYKKVGGCDSKYSGVQDWDLALKISNSHKMLYLAESLYCHRVHVKSVTLSDREAQFRKTNMVRRRFLEEWRKKHVISNSISIYSKDEWPSFARLKEDWLNGNICVADMRGEMNLAQVNYLREFCSYFDEILWTDPLVPAALYGYLSSGIKLIDMR